MTQHVSDSNTLVDLERENNDHDHHNENLQQADIKHDPDGEWSEVEFWLKQNDILTLKTAITEHKIDSMKSLTEIALNTQENNNNSQIYQSIIQQFANDYSTQQKFINGLNSLLKLDKTNSFLSKLSQLSSVENIEKENVNDWLLILIDGDDVDLVLNEFENNHSRRVNNTVEYGLNLLESSIYRLINNYDKKNEIFGYHLGSDLFALFVNDNIENGSLIGNKLLTIMRSDESPFRISVGIGTRKIVNYKRGVLMTNEVKECDNQETSENVKNTVQREWSLSAHINLLRAKENGKNCCFSDQCTINLNNNNKELMKLTNKMAKFYYDDEYQRSEQFFYSEILTKFDENAILNQCITKDFIYSPYSILAGIVASKDHIGNFKYRAEKQEKLRQTALKTFVIGKMTIECYYYFKSKQVSRSNQLNAKFLKSHNYDYSNKNDRAIKYDLTLLTRCRTADIELTSDISKRNNALHLAKSAWEHVNGAESDVINRSFIRKLQRSRETHAPFCHRLCHEALTMSKKSDIGNINIRPDWSQSLATHHIARQIISKQKDLNKAVEMADKLLENYPNAIHAITRSMKIYGIIPEKYPKRMSRFNSKYTSNELINKVLSLCHRLVKLEQENGKELKFLNAVEIVEKLYTYSPDIETNKETQKMVLKLYQNVIKRNQSLGWDVIINWTRECDRFPDELLEIIIRYWYLPSYVGMNNVILNCVDLINTCFINDRNLKKYKNEWQNDWILIQQAKALSNIISQCGNIKKIHYKKRDRSRKEILVCVSMQKPAKYKRNTYINGPQIDDKFNWDIYGTVICRREMDGGGFLQATRPENEKKFTPVTPKYIIKIGYFFAFMSNDSDVFNQVGFPVDKMECLTIVIIRLIIHYSFVLIKQEHLGFDKMIQDSAVMGMMIPHRIGQFYSENLAILCDKIEKIVDLDTNQSMNMIWGVLTPYITIKENKYVNINVCCM